MNDSHSARSLPPIGSALKPWHPTQIGRYRIVSLLGEGGMGVVYEAEQDQPRRMVALKVVREDFVTPELVRRFALESQVLGRLQHPGIAQIFDAGTFAEEHATLPYFAMELVKGQPLTEHAKAKSLDLRQRLALFARVCDAVQYAHQQGVIHRDLKPANILVDESGQPKVLDFGVARLTDADVQATRQTSVGEVIGTLQYMSPEQANADATDIDARSDVYSLGVILYELISGRLPYDLSRKLIHEAARIIVLEEPERLSSVNRQLRGDVEVIVAKALEKEKERRYGSADAMASDVRRYLNDEPITARPSSAFYQLRKFARRNRALVTGLGVAAAVLVVGTVVSVYQAIRATTAEQLAQERLEEAITLRALAERRQAVADSALLVVDSARQIADSARLAALGEQALATASAQRATAEAAKATAVNTFLQDMLASSDPSNALGKDLSVREVLDRAAERVGNTELARQPDVRAGIENTIGRTYYALGLYRESQQHLDSAYAIRRRVLGPTNLALASTAADVALAQQARGEFAAAERTITDALTVMRRSLPPDDDRITAALITLADIRYKAGDNTEAERLYREALQLARRRHGNRGPVVATRLYALGNFLGYTERLADAEVLLRESLALRQAVLGATHPDLLPVMVSLADVTRYQRRFPQSEAMMRDALPIARTLYGSSHPTVADVENRLGTVLSDQGKSEEAEPLLRSSLAIRMQRLGERHPDVQLARTDLGRFMQLLGRFDEADTLFNAALHARRAELGPGSPAVASSLNDLGYLARLQSRWVEAEQRYREALPIWTASDIFDQADNARAEIGWALLKQERFDDAEAMLNDVLSQRRARYGDQSFPVGDAYEKLAPIFSARRDFAKAESLTMTGLEIRRTVFGPRALQVAGPLQNVAFLREAQNDTAGAVPALRESLAMFAALRPASDINVLNAQRWLATDLCTTGAAAEGDSLLTVAIANAATDPASYLPFRLQGARGYCRLQQRQYAEAEPLLLAAERGLRTLPSATPAMRAEATRWLVTLYERWGKPEEATRWRGAR
jgi:eukaryotic-like serine/threonine-protein kinase